MDPRCRFRVNYTQPKVFKQSVSASIDMAIMFWEFCTVNANIVL